MPSASALYNSGRWLNAADLQPLNQRRTAIVQHVEEVTVGMGNDQKTQLNVSLTSRQGQPWPKTLLLNKGNMMQLATAHGDDYSLWIGKPIEVWSELVQFQGKLVPGIKLVAIGNGAAPAVGNQAHSQAQPQASLNPSPPATAATGMPKPNNTADLDDEIPF